MALKKKMPESWVGVDGTRTGWVVFVWKSDETYKLWHVSKLIQLELLTKDQFNVQCIALDIPLGLLQIAQRDGRGCDREARRVLASAKRNSSSKSSTLQIVGPSSIFTPPSRIALAAFTNGGSHAKVSAVNIQSVKEENTSSRQGLGLSIQTCHIIPKMKEADEFVSASPRNKTTAATAFDHCIPAFECHPELAFLAFSTKTTLPLSDEKSSLEDSKGLYSKKTIHGRRQRLELLCKGQLKAQKLLSFVTRESKGQIGLTEKKAIDLMSSMATWKIPSLSSGNQDGGADLISVAADDVLDAIVCASSSRRWAFGQAIMIKEEGEIPHGEHGLPMVIWV